MFFGELRSNPDDRDCLKTRRICQQLPQVVVIGLFQLIFNQDKGIAEHVLAKDICTKWPDECLRSFDFERKPKRFGKDFQILVHGKPRREMSGFTQPYVAESHALQATELTQNFQPNGFPSSIDQFAIQIARLVLDELVTVFRVATHQLADQLLHCRAVFEFGGQGDADQ